MFNFRRLLALVLLVSVVVLTVSIYRHYKQRAPEELLEMLPENIDLALDDFHYTQNEDGQRQWTLSADKAEYQRKNLVANLEKVKMLFYQVGEFGDVHLRADQGRLNQETSEIDIWGDVVLTTDEGHKFFTERMNYNDHSQLLTTDEKVRLVSPQLELTGTGMEMDLDRRTVLVKNDVRVLLYPAEMEKK
jgi:LPS export ABC transporter protein LptC